jgi:tetratricopeptide (TPR) repeat protein
MMKASTPHQMNPYVLLVLGVFLVFSVTGFLLYSNTFNSPFVFDDIAKIKENPDIRLTHINLKKIFDAGFGKSSPQSRPLGNLTFALNYFFHQYNVTGYHVVNVSIHILSAFFLYLFLKTTLKLSTVQTRYKQPHIIAFFAALIWLVHPVATQSVTYIVQRLNSLAALFFVLAFYLYLKGRLADQSAKKWSWIGAAALSWVLALGCKQNAATLPFFIFVYEWYFFQDLSKEWLTRRLKYLLGITAFFILLFLIYTGFNPWEKIQSFHDYGLFEFTIGERILTQFRVVVYYLSLIFFPHSARLNLDYDFPLSYSLINPPTTLLALVVILGLVGIAFYLSKKHRLISFCIIWFFGNLVIESSILPLAIIFEHRIYLPSMLVILLVVMLAFDYIKPRWLTIAMLCIAITICSYWTYERNKIWQSKLTIWGDSVQKSPNKARPHINMGKSLSDLERTDEAIKHFNISLRIEPHNPEAHHNLAVALAKQGKMKGAIDHFLKALKVKPDASKTHLYLGLALAMQGKTDQAIDHFNKTLQIDPTYDTAHKNLGILLMQEGKIETAIFHLREAIRLNPGLSGADSDLKKALAVQEKIQYDTKRIQRELRLAPDNPQLHYEMGNLFLVKGELNKAISQYEKALLLQPNYLQALNNLALAYAKKKAYAKALSVFQRILSYWPDNADTYYNIAAVYSKLNEIDKSIHWLKQALGRGYDNWDLIKTDPDLANIRDALAYKKLIKDH